MRLCYIKANKKHQTASSKTLINSQRRHSLIKLHLLQFTEVTDITWPMNPHRKVKDFICHSAPFPTIPRMPFNKLQSVKSTSKVTLQIFCCGVYMEKYSTESPVKKRWADFPTCLNPSSCCKALWDLSCSCGCDTSELCGKCETDAFSAEDITKSCSVSVFTWKSTAKKEKHQGCLVEPDSTLMKVDFF